MASTYMDPTGCFVDTAVHNGTYTLVGATPWQAVSKAVRQPAVPSNSTYVKFESNAANGSKEFFFNWENYVIDAHNPIDHITFWFYLETSGSTAVYAFAQADNVDLGQFTADPGHITTTGTTGAWFSLTWAYADGNPPRWLQYAFDNFGGTQHDKFAIRFSLNNLSYTAPGEWIRCISMYAEIVTFTLDQVVSDTIGFSGGNDTNEYRNEAVSDSTTFAHSGTETSSRALAIADTLAFTHLGTGSKAFASMAVAFAHAVSLGGSYYNLSVVDRIAFLDEIHRVIDVALTDAIAMGGAEAIRGPTMFPVEIVLFGEALVGLRHKMAATGLVFSDGATRASINHTASKSDTMQFQDYAYETVQIASSFQALVQVGPIIKDCDRYSTSLGISGHLVLSYPVNTPTSTVTLRVPKFGNEREYTVMAKVKRTLDQFPRVVRKSTWPKIETHHFSICYLTVTQRDAFLAFVDLTAGQMIRVVDQDNVNWQGVITTPVPTTHQEGPGCQYSLDFSFRGTVI